MPIAAAGERIRAAAPSDLSSLTQLLQESNLPVAGLPVTLEHFFVAEQGGTMLAAAGLEVYGRSALLRSVVVHPRYRRAGPRGGPAAGRGVVDVRRVRGLSTCRVRPVSRVVTRLLRRGVLCLALAR